MIRSPRFAIVAALAVSVSAGGSVQAQQPAPPAAAAPPATAPRCDAGCVRANADRAVQACAPRIEAESPGDYDWVTRPYGSIFQEADTPEQQGSAVIRYRGDSIRFLNPQEKWVRAIYECGYDAASQQVAYVRVRLGVLGRRSAIPVVPPGPQASRSPAAPVPSPAPNPGAPQPAAVNLRLIGEPSPVDVRQIPPGARP